MSKAEATFKLDDSFIKKYESIKPPFGFNGLGELVYMRCVPIETPVLCGDFQWRPAGELKIGDPLIAFDEYPDNDTGERYIRLGEVTDNEIQEAECVEIELEDGTLLHSTPEHPWLAFGGHGRFEWVRASNLDSGRRGAAYYLPRFLDVSKRDNSFDSGYLSAAFDGEGSLDGPHALCFVQTENEMLERVVRILDEKGFDYTLTAKKLQFSESSFESYKQCYQIRFGSRKQMFRFMTEHAPARLMQRFKERIESLTMRCSKSDRLRVVAVRPSGVKKIALLSTSTKTHFTDGFPSHNTYSRVKEDGKNEQWFETVRRVVEGTYRMQERHIKAQDLGWSEARAQKSAREMYDRIFNMKFLPPGRGLWAMGTPLIEERGLHAALNNCGFASTDLIDKDGAEPFAFLMDASMLGVGVGFDVAGAGKVKIVKPEKAETYVIADSREGWVDSTAIIINAYMGRANLPDFDYSQIRGPGLIIKGFGGVSSGPEPLVKLHKRLIELFEKNIGKEISITVIADCMNLEGVCVVAGNVRRTAEIMFGPADSEEYRNLKNYRWNAEKKKYEGPAAHRAEWGWTSNNSVFVKVGQDYSDLAEQTAKNGEPGYFWLDNARAYGRMSEPANWKDKKIKGANPCNEQSLEDRELCCLVETFPDRHESLEDYKRTLKFAYLYAKTVTLGKTHWPKTNRVLLRNRRIGTSMSGIAQFIAHRGLDELKRWCDEGYRAIQEYDKNYSDWLAVPLSIKTTSIKPSGSVSLLAGATPGCHDPEDHYYIRRARVGVHSGLLDRIIEAGYPTEPAVDDPSNTAVVEVPCSVDESIPTVKDTTIWEKTARAAFLQRYWADNQVSCTVSFDPAEADQIKNVLDYFQYDLKGISFLPRLESGAYAQMPYEAITKEEYERRASALKPLNFTNISEEAEQERGCDGASCAL